MRSDELVTQARAATKAFGIKCTKFGGGVAVAILKKALEAEGVPMSPPDVFVRGVAIQIDLAVPCAATKQPTLSGLYDPNEVAVALEVKKTGTFGERSLEKIRRDFQVLAKAGVRCGYVTFEERKGYRWAATRERIGFPCFTLAWHETTDGPLEATSDSDALVQFVREALRGGTAGTGNW